jgi:hypothetical protein
LRSNKNNKPYYELSYRIIRKKWFEYVSILIPTQQSLLSYPHNSNLN